MEFVTFSNWNELPPGSQILFTRAEEESLFFSQDWFEILTANVLGEDQSLLLACVVDGDETLAILPLIRRSGGSWNCLFHLYSSLYALLLADDNQQLVLTCLAEGLSQLPFDVLKLTPVAEDDENINALQAVMERSGFSCYRHFRFYNWYLRLEGQSFNEYMDARPTRVKNTIARKQRKLAREHDYVIRLYTGDDVPGAMVDYNTIYNASWKANEQFSDLLKAMAEQFSVRGWARLAILYIDGKPAAAHLWFVVHHKASIFRLAYDEAWKHYSPGSILMRYMMEYVVETDRVEEIDFLTGNDRYKHDWMTERRERWMLTCMKDHEIKSSRKGFYDLVRLIKNRFFRSH